MDLGVRASSPIDPFERDASLGRFAGYKIANFPAPLMCHVATWFYASQKNIYLNRWFGPDIMEVATEIASLPEGPQNALLKLPRSGHWDFNQTGSQLPPIGSVMLWDQGPTHSAIITENGITGYNQAVVFSPHIISAGHTHGQPKQVSPSFRKCFVISEEAIEMAAKKFFPHKL